MQFCICFRFEMHQDVITHGNILMNYTGKNFELYLPSRAQFVDLKKPWREPINQQQKIRPSERTNNHSYLPTYLPPPFAHWSFSRNVHVANMKMIELFWMEWNVVWRNSFDLISNFCDRTLPFCSSLYINFVLQQFYAVVFILMLKKYCLQVILIFITLQNRETATPFYLSWHEELNIFPFQASSPSPRPTWPATPWSVSCIQACGTSRTSGTL